jgi:uncharacterized phage protein (TIGR01671 family)
MTHIKKLPFPELLEDLNNYINSPEYQKLILNDYNKNKLKAMRVIKFRVWDGVKMWYPNDENSLFLMIGDSGFFSVQDHSTEYFKAAPLINNHKDLDVINSAEDSLFIMQFTGLKDKNGKDIYEGDIIRYTYPRDTTGKDIAEFTEVVEWENNTDLLGFCIHQKMNHEVIGSIYETPELLK